eukprot:EW705375.1.p4 GENE.EW705375.1~~EW705375.1.p4  ORF type:complete len:109 (+),score=17.33 EW705375.1:148-474(+)
MPFIPIRTRVHVRAVVFTRSFVRSIAFPPPIPIPSLRRLPSPVSAFASRSCHRVGVATRSGAARGGSSLTLSSPPLPGAADLHRPCGRVRCCLLSGECVCARVRIGSR